MRRLTTEEFILKSKDIYGDLYSYDKTKYKNTRTKVIIKCKNHGYFFIKPTNHIHNNQGCAKCSRDRHKFTELSDIRIELLNKIHHNRYEYKRGVISGRINIKCPSHSWFEQSFYNHKNGHGCPNCSSSKGERNIKRFLDSKGVKYETEKTFYNCLSPRNRKLKFDFYLPDYKICIEYDGIQHFESKEYFGGDEFLKYIQICDSIKDNFCENREIKLIRIPYFDDYLDRLGQIKF